MFPEAIGPSGGLVARRVELEDAEGDSILVLIRSIDWVIAAVPVALSTETTDQVVSIVWVTVVLMSLLVPLNWVTVFWSIW